VGSFVEFRALRKSTGGAPRHSQGAQGVGAWFAANDAVGIVLWSLVPTALAAVAGCAVLRRATPMN
jgi:hypothetical protein